LHKDVGTVQTVRYAALSIVPDIAKRCSRVCSELVLLLIF